MRQQLVASGSLTDWGLQAVPVLAERMKEKSSFPSSCTIVETCRGKRIRLRSLDLPDRPRSRTSQQYNMCPNIPAHLRQLKPSEAAKVVSFFSFFSFCISFSPSLSLSLSLSAGDPHMQIYIYFI